MTEEIKDWGCPDWRDASAYPSNLDELKFWQWKWEFVRRLPRYRELYSLYRTDDGSNYRPSGELAETILEDFGLAVLVSPAAPMPPDDYCPFPQLGGALLYFPTWEAHREAILDNPADEQLKAAMDILKHMHQKLDRVDSGQSLAIFDVRKPLKPQLELAERRLEARGYELFGEIKEFRHRRENWLRHLRVIDAQDQGASDKDIYDQFLTELEDDIEKYDELAGLESPYVLIHDWKKAARTTMEKAALSL